MKRLFNWLATLSFKKLFTWLDQHILKILVVVLLIWIPLYPKFPLLDVMYTWVYIRLEDFLVAFTALVFIFLLIRKKAEIKTPLTKPIFLYWLVGGVSAVWAILFFAPSLPHIFSHIVLLHYLRRVEYMLLFFLVVASIRSKKDISAYLVTVFLTLLGVISYGLGQRFLGFPAFLTMNEEFSKGLPLYLPSTARITSTFGGHYDLAAYLVLLIALSTSLIFTLKHWWLKIILIILTALSFLLLLLTASRISFFAYLLAISAVLFFQKKKILIIPVIALSIYLMQQLSGGASVRFGKTFRIEPVVFETRSGRPIATLRQFTAKPTPTPIQLKLVGPTPTPTPPSPSTGGEDLPLGSGFLALPISLEEISEEIAAETSLDREKLAQLPQELILKIQQKKVQISGKPEEPIFLESLEMATVSAEIATKSGEFLLTSGDYFVKKAIVYDISFTTRFQGEWPRAWEAFKRNVFLGSGYSSVSLATDNDYLRSLGETGIIGFITFWGVLFILVLVIRQILRSSPSRLLKGLAIGLLGGMIGLLFNAVLIDVFEASKVAFIFWMLVGLVIGLAKFYPQFARSLWQEAKDILVSHLSVILFFGILAAFCFRSSLNNYFVADDFIWLRWAAISSIRNIEDFFFNSYGFFYRPLAKTLFLFIQPISSLQPEGYHLVSLFFHFLGAIAAYFLTLKLTKKKLIAFITASLFLLHPIHEENIFWISSLSILMASVFYLLSFLFYLSWREEKRISKFGFWIISLILFILALCSHELAVTLPLALIFYDFLYKKHQNKIWEEFLSYLPYILLIPSYLLVRFYSGAHGLSGDYNYRLSNLPFNFIGNFFGYLGELIFSFPFSPLYQKLRFFLRARKLFALILALAGISLFSLIFAYFKRKNKKIVLPRIIIFSLGWIIITLLPFLGLGNITERYAYLASFGFLLGVVFFLNWLKDQLKKRVRAKFALVVLLISVTSLSYFYYTEIQKANRDWQEAGEISKTTLLALSSNYKKFPAETSLIFANLPVKKGLAWVFPVGLEEGIWFIYRNEDLRIYRTATAKSALDLKENLSGQIFVFLLNEEGELKRVSK